MPTTESPEKLLEMAIGRLLQRSHGIDLEALAQSTLQPAGRRAAVGADPDLPACRRDRGRQPGTTSPTSAGCRGRSWSRRSTGWLPSGLAARSGREFSLTPAGAAEISSARNIISGWLTESLAQSPEFEGRPDRLQVQGALDRLARGVLMERDPAQDETRPMKLGPSRRPVVEPPTTRMRTPVAGAPMEPPTRPFRPRAGAPPRGRPRPPRR